MKLYAIAVIPKRGRPYWDCEGDQLTKIFLYTNKRMAQEEAKFSRDMGEYPDGARVEVQQIEIPEPEI